MNTSVVCPHCQAKLKPKNALIPGKSVRCPGCKEQFLPEAVYAVEPLDEATPAIRSSCYPAWQARAVLAKQLRSAPSIAQDKRDSGTAERRAQEESIAKEKQATSRPPSPLGRRTGEV